MSATALDEIISVASEDTAMNEAIAAAHASLLIFMEAFRNPGFVRSGFSLKVLFSRDGMKEHIWMTQLNLSQTPYWGEVANDPGLPGMKLGQCLPFTEKDISDWMYFDGDKIAGGFTTRLLLQRQHEQKMAATFHPKPYMN